MTQADGDAVERLYLRLADALRTRGAAFDRPITVAEIYQELVPYRTVRSDVGFGMNADYEHALLRLLAGDGGYVRLDPAQATKELRRELDSPNPNLGMYREFAGCDAWVAAPEAGIGTADDDTIADDLPWLDEVAGRDEDVADAAPDWSALAALAPDADAEETVPAPVNTFALVEPEPAAAEGAAAPPPAAARTEPHCAFCDSALPTHRPVRFCPFCGADQSTRPCTECGEKVEPGWAYCIACGAGRD